MANDGRHYVDPDTKEPYVGQPPSIHLQEDRGYVDQDAIRDARAIDLSATVVESAEDEGEVTKPDPSEMAAAFVAQSKVKK
jgi:hypothetical protein